MSDHKRRKGRKSTYQKRPNGTRNTVDIRSVLRDEMKTLASEEELPSSGARDRPGSQSPTRPDSQSPTRPGTQSPTNFEQNFKGNASSPRSDCIVVDFNATTSPNINHTVSTESKQPELSSKITPPRSKPKKGSRKSRKADKEIKPVLPPKPFPRVHFFARKNRHDTKSKSTWKKIVGKILSGRENPIESPFPKAHVVSKAKRKSHRAHISRSTPAAPTSPTPVMVTVPAPSPALVSPLSPSAAPLAKAAALVAPTATLAAPSAVPVAPPVPVAAPSVIAAPPRISYSPRAPVPRISEGKASMDPSPQVIKQSRGQVHEAPSPEMFEISECVIVPVRSPAPSTAGRRRTQNSESSKTDVIVTEIESSPTPDKQDLDETRARLLPKRPKYKRHVGKPKRFTPSGWTSPTAVVVSDSTMSTHSVSKKDLDEASAFANAVSSAVSLIDMAPGNVRADDELSAVVTAVSIRDDEQEPGKKSPEFEEELDDAVSNCTVGVASPATRSGLYDQYGEELEELASDDRSAFAEHTSADSWINAGELECETPDCSQSCSEQMSLGSMRTQPSEDESESKYARRAHSL